LWRENVGDEDRWTKVREIVREECERIETRILLVLEKHGQKPKLGFVNGKWTGVTNEQLEAWKAAYGAVDIEAELKKAAAWIVSNPHLAPKSQLGRFLNTWFARTQDRSSIRSIPSPSERTAIAGPGKKLCSYCDRVATSSPNRTWACDEHMMSAMHHEPVPMFKSGVTAKPVSGS
jgi:hypothetical protein